jgi:hypothetical protein
MLRTGSWLRGQFGLAIDTRRTPRVPERQGRVVCQWLIECLAMDVFQEVAIDIVSDSGGRIRLGARPNWPMTRGGRVATVPRQGFGNDRLGGYIAARLSARTGLAGASILGAEAASFERPCSARLAAFAASLRVGLVRSPPSSRQGVPGRNGREEVSGAASAWSLIRIWAATRDAGRAVSGPRIRGGGEQALGRYTRHGVRLERPFGRRVCSCLA